ncbi:MAG: carboxypeptidase regulatory-like domain-containing protein [Methylococcaceae bacterium]|nr:carboxypeptidase regulatory-like domain-containing protein [Methylococcaceae bacterium]
MSADNNNDDHTAPLNLPVEYTATEDKFYKLKVTNKLSKIRPRTPGPVVLELETPGLPKTLKGRTISYCTGNPLPNAVVILETDQNNSTVSAYDGKYAMPSGETPKTLQARSPGHMIFKRNDFNDEIVPINADDLGDQRLVPTSGCETPHATALFNCATEVYPNDFYNPKESYAEGNYIREYGSGWRLKISSNGQSFGYQAPDMPSYDEQYSQDQMNDIHCKGKGKGY